MSSNILPYQTGGNPNSIGLGAGVINPATPSKYVIINGRAIPVDAVGGSITEAVPKSTGNAQIDKINQANFDSTKAIDQNIDVNKFQGATVSPQAIQDATKGVSFSQKLQQIVNTYNQKDVIAQNAKNLGGSVNSIPIQTDVTGADINQRRTDLLLQNAVYSGVDPKTITATSTPLTTAPTNPQGVADSINHAISTITDNSSLTNGAKAVVNPNNPNQINVTLDPAVSQMLGDQISKALASVVGNNGTITPTPNGSNIDLNPPSPTTTSQPTDILTTILSNPLYLIAIIAGIVFLLFLVGAFKR